MNKALQRYTITFDYHNTLLTLDYSYTQMCALGVKLVTSVNTTWFQFVKQIFEPYGIATYPSPTQDDESYTILTRFTQFVKDFNNDRNLEVINV